MATTTTKKTTKPKTTAKKTTEKTTAPKKAAVKTTAAKTTAKKTTTAKTTAAKTTVKKAAAPKTAAKTTAKKTTTAKTTAAKTTVKKAAAPKTASSKKTVKSAEEKSVKKEPVATEVVEDLDPNIKYRNLFEAYATNKLPFANGYIISSFFKEESAYSIYEVVSYSGVKEIFMTDTGLQFTTGGKKLYILVEPDIYRLKHMEPVSRSRSGGEHIPKRFSELEIIIAKNQTKIMIAKDPNESYGAFTILTPRGSNFAVLFYQLPDVYTSIAEFFTNSLNRQRKVPQADAKKAAQMIAATIKTKMGFKGEYE